MKKFTLILLAVCCITWLCHPLFSQEQEIYWDKQVPKNWNGKWTQTYLTIPEKTNFTRTTSTLETHEFISMLKWNSEYLHVFEMYISPLRKVCPVVVMANPRITSPKAAIASGKPVIYLQGNIHPPEAEGKEALLMVMRDILLGEKAYLLDNQIILCCPNFNVDGNDTWRTRDGTPYLIGHRHSADDFDLNRDAIKLESTEVKGLFRNVINTWDPILLFDAHAMGREKHAYAIAYATSTLPTAHPGPRQYVWEKLFPTVRSQVRKNFKLEIFTHCSIDNRVWPPVEWSHNRSWWTIEGKFVANYYGLRNRMSILVETPGHPPFEKRIYSQYAFISELLEFIHRNGSEMKDICQKAETEVVNQIKAKAADRDIENFVDGKYESYGPIELLAYKENKADYIPGTSVRDTKPGTAEGIPLKIPNVQHVTKPVGTKKAIMPRGYLIPAAFKSIIDKLRMHKVQVTQLKSAVTAQGDVFDIQHIEKEKYGYRMTTLKGQFKQNIKREFPAGSFLIDLAQPLANVAYYCLEPESKDGFVGWGLFEEYFQSRENNEEGFEYPVFKYFKIL